MEVTDDVGHQWPEDIRDEGNHDEDQEHEPDDEEAPRALWCAVQGFAPAAESIILWP
jgi:hypothetical protein